ncbi:MAG: lysine--tRNA ligase [Elusimicrobiota bacterium]
MKDNSIDQFKIRKDKLSELEKRNITPYPNSFKSRITVKNAINTCEGEKVRVCGRILSSRDMGKSVFSHIKDRTGKIQIYLRIDKLDDEQFDLYKDLDIGDFIGVEGELFLTRTKEKTVLVEKFEVLSKSLRPLPEKFHGLKDTEIRYRKRYLDILVNPEVSEVLKMRSEIIQDMREILREKNFIEVETPMLQEIPGGAAARPFKTHHNVFDIDLYLRIAPELYLKRLLVGGWEKVFEIGKNFRNEGISTRHNPEFTMMEVYCAYTDYRYMMELSKEIICGIDKKIKDSGFETNIDLSQGWEEKSIWDLLSEYTGTEFLPGDNFEKLKQKAEKLDVPPGKDSAHKIVDRIFSKYVQDNLIKPVFVTGFLSKDSPLAKSSPENEIFAERFEIFINGQEIGNAYSEQNNPVIQREMFEMQAEQGEEYDKDKKIDEDYLESLEYGMPPASGLGIGVDRLVMAITGKDSIREVILFPMLRPI